MIKSFISFLQLNSCQWSFVLLMFSGGKETDQWNEMG